MTKQPPKKIRDWIKKQDEPEFAHFCWWILSDDGKAFIQQFVSDYNTISHPHLMDMDIENKGKR